MRTRWIVALTLAAAAIFATRRPDAVLNPQFWAEDVVWYANAYDHGLASLAIPHAGYHVLICRLVALFVLPLPLAWAPACYNACALAVAVLPVALLASKRFESVVPSAAARFALGCIYVGLPASGEIFGTVTNTMWRIGPLVAMMVIADPPRSLSGRIVDQIAFLISGMSGPFAALCAPLALLRWRQTGDLARLPGALILCAGGVAQVAIGIAICTEKRGTGPLGANIADLARIAGSHIVAGALMGQPGIRAAVQSDLLRAVGAAIAVAVTTWVVVRGSTALRYWVAFTALALAAVLAFPMRYLPTPMWAAMAAHPGGVRYWYIPMLGFLPALVACCGDRKWRWLAAPLLALLPIGVVADWRYAALPDLNFQAHARRWEAALPGETVTITVNPGWSLTLTKRGDRAVTSN